MEICYETNNQKVVPWGRCMESIRILESRHVMSLLVFLRDRGPTNKMDIYETVARGPNMSEKLEVLESMGILRMEKSGKTIVSLTETGEEVADHLKAVMSLMV